VRCGLAVKQRTHHQITGEPMKFLTLADWTGMVETELFAQTYKPMDSQQCVTPFWKSLPESSHSTTSAVFHFASLSSH
jgi:hypothetical protein